MKNTPFAPSVAASCITTLATIFTCYAGDNTNSTSLAYFISADSTQIIEKRLSTMPLGTQKPEHRSVCHPGMESGISGDRKFWASIDHNEMASSQNSSLEDIAGSHKITSDFFGAKFEVKSGPPIICWDPMKANDPNEMALQNALNNRVVISENLSASQASGFIWTPLKNKNFEFNATGLTHASFNWHF